MEYKKLPRVVEDKSLFPEYFPNPFYAAVFRLWETVDAEDIARATGTSADIVKKAAEDMGFPPQGDTKEWKRRGYITTIRNSWHILPYDQLLSLLDWSEEKLAIALKEEDFLKGKLGSFKPYCRRVQVEELNGEQKEKLAKIRSIVKMHFSDIFNGAKPFEFFDEAPSVSKSGKADGIRMIYSYCGLFASVLDNDIDLSYPDILLDMYRSAGINAVWLPVVLYQVTPFPFDESYSKGWEKRIVRLRELIKKAEDFGIKVFLYLNEPRCMPEDFFKKRPDLRGSSESIYTAMCTSNPEVIRYLRNAVRMLCESVPEIGGFFVITCSENLTHCKSRAGATECPHCKDVPVSKLVSDVLCAISEESRKVNPEILTIAWTWAWDEYMTWDEMAECIDAIPEEVIIQCNSEAQKEFTIGGVTGNIQDYSMSIPGPAPLSEYIWDYAKKKGHEVSAKVQVNVTWECSTLPYLPVFDLIREHMTGLREKNVEHIMLSWTLGGYPSVNLKVATDCLEDSSEEKYISLLKSEYGEYADSVKKAASIFSEAFREFPFDILSVYTGPQNGGPSNFIYDEPTGFKATMTCFTYDDIDSWRSIYPKDVYIGQLKKLRDGWKKGLEATEHMPDCEFKQMVWGAYALFNSSYLQAEFTDKRDCGDSSYLIKLIDEEEKMVLLMYELMQKNNLIGYEAANHYYFNKGKLAEKIINCEYLKEKILNSNK